MEIGATLKLAGFLFGINLLAQGVDGLIKIRRGKIGGERLGGAKGKSVAFAIFDKTPYHTLWISGLASILFKGDATKDKPLAHVGPKSLTHLPPLISGFNLGVSGQGIKKFRRNQNHHLGHELAEQVVLNIPLQLQTLGLDIGVDIIQLKVDGFGGDAKLVIEVVKNGTVCIQNDPLQSTHAQMFQRNRMFISHRLQVHGHHIGQGSQVSFTAKHPNSLYLTGEDDVVVRDVGDDERSDLPLAAHPNGAWCSDRRSGEQRQNAVAFFDSDLPQADCTSRHQVHLPDHAVSVGENVDGSGQGHRIKTVI